MPTEDSGLAIYYLARGKGVPPRSDNLRTREKNNVVGLGFRRNGFANGANWGRASLAFVVEFQ